MKIGIVSPYYMHSYGGVQTLISNMRSFLAERGHEVVVIAPRPRLEEAVEKTPAGIAMLGASAEINFRNPFHTTFPLAASNRQLVADFLVEQRFDVLHIHEPWMPLLPYQILQEATCPIVGTTHHRWPRSWLNKSLEKARTPYFRLVLSKLDKITAVSMVAAKNVTLVDKDFKVMIIPNAVDCGDYARRIKAARRRGGRPYILYLNRLERRKGPRLLLKAYRRYAAEHPSPLPLVIAGSGPQAESLASYVANHDLGRLVRFEGYVSDERKMELFANARLYVSPAPFGESFGIVLLEAMAADLPLLAGHNEGYRSVLSGDGSVSLVNPYKSEGFAASLAKLAHDRPARENWLDWAREEIKKYDYPVIIDQYENCFKEVVR